MHFTKNVLTMTLVVSFATAPVFAADRKDGHESHSSSSHSSPAPSHSAPAPAPRHEERHAAPAPAPRPVERHVAPAPAPAPRPQQQVQRPVQQPAPQQQVQKPVQHEERRPTTPAQQQVQKPVQQPAPQQQVQKPVQREERRPTTTAQPQVQKPVQQPAPQQQVQRPVQHEERRQQTPSVQVNPRKTETAKDKGMNGFFKPEAGKVERKEIKGGGFVEKQGDKSVQYRPDHTKAQVVNGNKVTNFDRNGNPTRVREVVRDSSGKVAQSKTQIVDRSGKVTVEKNITHVNNVKIVNNYTNVRTNVRYNERVIANNHIQRTYIVNNRTYYREYRPVYYGGRSYYGYVPGAFWAGYFAGAVAAQFYYNPWSTPWVYTGYWNANPWYGYYGYYWHPYPSYRAAYYWVADYALASYISDSYAERAEDAANRSEAAARRAQQAANNAGVITDVMKEQIAIQVRQEMEAFKQGQTVPLDSVLNDTKHLFVVDDSISAEDEATGNACGLEQGDIIRLVQPVNGQPAARLTVVAAKQDDDSCNAGSVVTLSTQTLADMNKAFSEKVESGLDEMKTKNINGAGNIRN